MNRIDAMFARARETGRTALVPYIACGHPRLEQSVPIMHALVAAGADLIELGIPFSDPMADGPTIQHACETALNQGVTAAHVLDVVSEFRKQDQTTPLILMGYMNPIERIGVSAFAQRSAEAGADGALIVDLPPEESTEFRRALDQQGLHQILLVAPTSPPARVAKICQHAGGFIYYVALKGITGASTLAADEVATAVQRLRGASSVPVGVGFGIKTAADAVALSQQADAVVIGSALVSELDQATDVVAAATRFLMPIRVALDRADVSAGTDVALS